MLETCDGSCTTCMFPTDYPEMFKVMEAVYDLLKEQNGGEDLDCFLEKKHEKVCLIFWKELEDGHGIPKEQR